MDALMRRSSATDRSEREQMLIMLPAPSPGRNTTRAGQDWIEAVS